VSVCESVGEVFESDRECARVCESVCAYTQEAF
jgi:hypothetical protein